uniref:Uncharacterized protein n=1 Tax=uncultured crenarchaeote TaxID=29281 RepID=Q702B8_9CREN|nr:hypothetical protein [uncultured crenarchaeote]
MNKSELTPVFVLMASSLLFVQDDNVLAYGQVNDTTTSSNSNLTVTAINSSIVDTKLKTQFPIADEQENSSVKTVTYTPKFLCGNVMAGEGPVRPGHYDTDISILNKQVYPIKLFMKVIPNDGKSSNSIIKVVESESATGITCKDILPLVTDTKNLTEGFVLLTLPISGSMINAFPDPNNPEASILKSIDESQANLIEVQVFYTANALPQLPSEIIFNKIDFRILSDPTGKIPQDLLSKTLEVTLTSNAYQVYDQVLRVKSLLREKFRLSDSEMNTINIQIEKTEINSLFTSDDHAISSSRLNPNMYFR